jgi:hypothetical protein
MLYFEGQTVHLFGFYGFLVSYTVLGRRGAGVITGMMEGGGWVFWCSNSGCSTNIGSQLKAFFKNSQSVQKNKGKYATLATALIMYNNHFGARFL